jgi:Undecaprenyl-phosphate glucose phosphotransferase
MFTAVTNLLTIAFGPIPRWLVGVCMENVEAGRPLVRERAPLLYRFHFAGDERALLLGGLRAADAAALLGSGALAYWFWHGALQISGPHWLNLAIGTLLGAQGLHFAGRYRAERLARGALGRALVAWTGAVLLVVAAIYFTGHGRSFSRAWVMLWWAGGCASLAGLELGFRCVLQTWRTKGKLISRVAVFGSAAEARRVAGRIEEQAAGDRRVVAICHQGEGGSGGDRRSEVDDVVRLARQVRIDEVVLAAAWRLDAELAEALERLGSLPTDVKLCATLLPPGVGPAIELPPIPIHRRPLAGASAHLKRASDVALSAVALVALLPVMVAIGVAVKLDSPGPAIYRQRRAGFNRNTFVVYKFRTMYVAESDGAVVQARRDDARVTRIGGLLRRLSLDELPQLLNVLRGEMSLVGPRPHAVPHDEQYGLLIDRYLHRHRVLPGITGWAQVNGWRGETDTIGKMKARIEHDLWYIENWSLSLDLLILLRTVFIALHDKHAY